MYKELWFSAGCKERFFRRTVQGSGGRSVCRCRIFGMDREVSCMELAQIAQQMNLQFAGREIGRLLAARPNPWMNLSPEEFGARICSAKLLSARIQDKWLKLSLSTGDEILIYPGVSGEVDVLEKLPALAFPFSGRLIYLGFEGAGCLRVRPGLFGRFYLSNGRNVLPLRGFWRWMSPQDGVTCSWIRRKRPDTPASR